MPKSHFAYWNMDLFLERCQYNQDVDCPKKSYWDMDHARKFSFQDMDHPRKSSIHIIK